jgi:hypothetical protein
VMYDCFTMNRFDEMIKIYHYNIINKQLLDGPHNDDSSGFYVCNDIKSSSGIYLLLDTPVDIIYSNHKLNKEQNKHWMMDDLTQENSNKININNKIYTRSFTTLHHMYKSEITKYMELKLYNNYYTRYIIDNLPHRNELPIIFI